MPATTSSLTFRQALDLLRLVIPRDLSQQQLDRRIEDMYGRAFLEALSSEEAAAARQYLRELRREDARRMAGEFLRRARLARLAGQRGASILNLSRAGEARRIWRQL